MRRRLPWPLSRASQSRSRWRVGPWTARNSTRASISKSKLGIAVIPNPAVVRVVDINQATSTLTLDQDVTNAIWLRRATTYLTQPDLPLLPPSRTPPATRPSGCLGASGHLCGGRRHPRGGAERPRCRGALEGGVPGESDYPPERPLTGLDPLNRGFLRARTLKTAVSTDPCIISPGSSYRGPENQLYRVGDSHSAAAWRPAQSPASSGRVKMARWCSPSCAAAFPGSGFLRSGEPRPRRPLRSHRGRLGGDSGR